MFKTRCWVHWSPIYNTVTAASTVWWNMDICPLQQNMHFICRSTCRTAHIALLIQCCCNDRLRPKASRKKKLSQLSLPRQQQLYMSHRDSQHSINLLEWLALLICCIVTSKRMNNKKMKVSNLLSCRSSQQVSTRLKHSQRKPMLSSNFYTLTTL